MSQANLFYLLYHLQTFSSEDCGRPLLDHTGTQPAILFSKHLEMLLEIGMEVSIPMSSMSTKTGFGLVSHKTLKKSPIEFADHMAHIINSITNHFEKISTKYHRQLGPRTESNYLSSYSISQIHI